MAGSISCVKMFSMYYTGQASEPMYAYRVSKAALNHCMCHHASCIAWPCTTSINTYSCLHKRTVYVCWAEENRKKGITFVLMYPGMVETDMNAYAATIGFKSNNNISGAESASKQLEVCNTAKPRMLTLVALLCSLPLTCLLGYPQTTSRRYWKVFIIHW